MNQPMHLDETPMLVPDSEIDMDQHLERRFAGLARLYGHTGAQRIRAAHVVVVGLGGVGSWAAEAAARSGIARLTLIDLDHIAESNINRQVHALDTTLGKAKVQAMQERIARINSSCQVDCIEEFVDAENWPAIASLGVHFDRHQVAVIDACDNVKAKTAMAAWALKNKVILVSVGAAGGKKLAQRVEIDDLKLVTHDPLLAQMRHRLRKEHGANREGLMGVACVFSREPVSQPLTACALDLEKSDFATTLKSQTFPTSQSDGSLNCHGYGSAVSVTSTFGMCAAGWVINKIAA